MNRSITTLLCCLGCTWMVLVPQVSQATDRPNIVFIIADDLGYGELGCYGGKEIPTPHLDDLAAGGIRFTSGYVSAPFCAASRAAMMTGQYQTRFGFEFNPIGAFNEEPGIGLPTSQKTIADHLQTAGYATALVGKWHLGGTAPFHPQRRGFDEFFGFLHEGHYFVPPPWDGTTTWLRRKGLPDGGTGRWTSPDGRVIWSTHMGHSEPPYDTNNPVVRSSQPVHETENLTDAFTREACDFIRRKHSQPFYLCLAYNAVHSPLQGKDAYMQRFAHIKDIQRRIFAAMLSHLDDSIGRVLDTLDETGTLENSLVVFLSDNGGPTKELTSSNLPLRGGKGELYEGGTRIPFIVSWKDHLKPNVIDTPVIAMDIGATALQLAEVDQKGKRLARDGINLLPLIKNAPDAETHETLFWRVGNKNALRHGDWKLIRNGNDWELYDLANDISETTNLASEHKDLVQHLDKQWQAWNSEQVEPLWGGKRSPTKR